MEAESRALPETALPLSRRRTLNRAHADLLLPVDPPAVTAAGQEAIEWRDQRYRWSLAFADLLSIALAVGVALVLLGDQALRPATLLVLPLVLVVSKIQGLYDRDVMLIRKTTIDETPKLFQRATICALLFWLLSDAFVAGDLAKEQVLALWATLFVAALVGRRTARAAVRRLSPVERCLFMGDASTYARLGAKFKTSDVNAELVGRMSLQRIAPRGERAGRKEDLLALVAWARVDRLIIESQALPGPEMLELVRTAKQLGVGVSLVPGVLDVVGTAVEFDDLDGMTLLGVRPFGLTRSSRAVKRAFDIAGAGLALLFLTPLLALVALAVRLDSPGPVFFRQTRVGRDGRHFRIWKFRTMCVGADDQKDNLRWLNEADGIFKIERDPRITRVGRVLRRMSLDELPQLINVLRGDMSLVGPRPLVVDEDERITGWDRSRLKLTPGMTGHWQVLGSSRVPLHEMVKLDYLYVAGWTLWSDLKILVRTVPYVLSRRGL